MGGENVGFLKIGMSPTLNLFAQNVSLVRVRVKTTKWLTWWTNFNGREQGKKMWMKLVKLHIQIPNFSCTDFSPSIILSNPLLWFFLVALGWFYEAILLHRTLIFDVQKFKKKIGFFFLLAKTKIEILMMIWYFFFRSRVESARRGCACGWWWWSWCEHLFMSTAYIWKEERCVLRCSKQETQSPFSRILQIKLTSVNSWIVIDQYTNFVTHWR